GAQPFARRGQARERARADRLAHRGDDVAGAVVLELLRGRPLLVDIVALALAERAVHLRARHVDCADRLVVEPALVTRVLEHRQRLAAVVDQHLLALELVPAELRIGRAAGEEEAVLLVDLGEMHRRRWSQAGLTRASSAPYYSATRLVKPDDLPLVGVTILDLTRVLAGPYCTRLLCDLGARVIKIERPGEGDEMRRNYLQLEPGRGDQSSYF